MKLRTNLEYLLRDTLALPDLDAQVFEATGDNDFDCEWTVTEI